MFRSRSFCTVTLTGLLLAPAVLAAQTSAAPTSAAQQTASPVRQLGTVKSIDGTNVTVITAAGAQVVVPVDSAARVLQLPPGSTDLKTATPAAFSDISVGDRVVTGKPGDTTSASRVILMKSSAISARNQAQQADWRQHGSGGLVKSVDGSAIAISVGPRPVKIDTSSTTIFRRYAPDSIKFEDARPGQLADIHPGDQLSVRGEKSADGAEIKADEVVTGTFSNLSGAISSIDPAAGTLTLKDLTTKRNVTIKVTANSDLRKLPPQAAAAFAARNSSAAATGSTASSTGNSAAGRSSAPAGSGTQASTASGSGPAGANVPGSRARAGMDLSRMLARLPAESLADLKSGDAVMIVASPSSDSAYTAITLLAGVEPLLTANSQGGQPLTLSPWNIGGGGAPEAGGAPQ